MTRTGRTSGRWPHYWLIDDNGNELGSVRRVLAATGANYSHERSDGWQAAGRIHCTRAQAEQAIIDRAVALRKAAAARHAALGWARNRDLVAEERAKVIDEYGSAGRLAWDTTK